MEIRRRACVLGVSVFCLLFLLSGTAYAQSVPPLTYLFVEVKDTSGKAVEDAAVTVPGAHDNLKTNKDGLADASCRLWYSTFFYSFQVSKPGYVTSEHVAFRSSQYASVDAYLREEFPNSAVDSGNPKPAPISVVLQRTPATPAEQRALEAEEQKRQLLLAAKTGDVARLRKYMGAGADTVDDKGVPVIAWAALAGDAETIKALLAAGADIRRKNTLAHQALLIYLAGGISQDRNRTDYKTAVERNEEVVRKLIEAGADVNAKSSYRGTVLNNAIAQAPYFDQPPYALSFETIKLLMIDWASVYAADESGRTPIMSAAAKSSAAIVKMLLDAGALINAKDNDGKTALIYALENSSGTETAKVLIAAGANINVAGKDGQTPLMLAARRHSIEAIKALIGAGTSATINAKDKQGKTALHYLSEMGNVSLELVKLLIEEGADVNAADGEALTPLI